MAAYGVSRNRPIPDDLSEYRDLQPADNASNKNVAEERDVNLELSQTTDGDSVSSGSDSSFVPRANVPHSASTSDVHPQPYIPSIIAAVAALDAFCIGVAQIGVIETIYNPFGLTGPTQFLSAASVFVLVYGIFICFMGCYRREALTDIALSVSRIVAALGLGGVTLFTLALFAFSALHPSLPGFASATMAALVSTGVALFAMTVSRTVSYAMVNQERFRGVVPVTAMVATVRDIDGSFAPFGRRPAPHSPLDSIGRLPRRYVPNVGQAVALLDALCIGVAQIGMTETIDNPFGLTGPAQFIVAASTSVMVFVSILYALGCYRPEAMTRIGVSASRIVVSLMLGGAAFFTVGHFWFGAFYPLHPVFASAEQSAMAALANTGIAMAAVVASRTLSYAMINQEWLKRRILVIGSGQRSQHLRTLMSDEAHRLAKTLIFVSESTVGGSQNSTLSGLHRLGHIESLVRELQIDEVVVATDGRQALSMEALLACKIYGTPIIDYNAFIERETGRIDLSWPDLGWMVYSDGFRLRFIDACVKRAVDILVSFALLIIVLPVLLIAVAAVWLEGTRPIFFTQQRVTLGGRIFWLYKLRTMRADSEIDGPRWAALNDARITRVGALLRRFRIDEIPQLVNILQGDMSLVGPRPEQPAFVEQLAQEIPLYNLRHSVKAGLTGWAQINYQYGASTADALRKLEYDLYYIKNYSLLRECSIILQTFRVLLWPPGVR